MQLRVYVIGRDVPPAEALSDPEIIVTASEFNGAGGWAVWGGGDACVVNNSMFVVKSYTYADMFSINSQEFGHCLGLGHIQIGGSDQLAYEDPVVGHDVMTGLYNHQIGSRGTHLHCLSNINMGGLEAAFAPLSSEGSRPKFPISASAKTYKIVFCPRTKRS